MLGWTPTTVATFLAASASLKSATPEEGSNLLGFCIARSRRPQQSPLQSWPLTQIKLLTRAALLPGGLNAPLASMENPTKEVGEGKRRGFVPSWSRKGGVKPAELDAGELSLWLLLRD